MSGLFAGTPLERPVTCEKCGQPLLLCTCPRDAQGKLHDPAKNPARVRREKRRGKVVTVVSGLGLKDQDLAALVKNLKSTLGAGGTAKDGEIEVQGDHRDRLVEVLKEMGYPAKAAGG